MRIQVQQLDNYLKGPLPPCFLLSGEEPYQKMEAIKSIREASEKQGFSEYKTVEILKHFDWDAWVYSLNSPSLFAEKSIIECRFKESNIGKNAATILMNLAKKPIPHTLFIMVSNKFDPNAEWFKVLDRLGISIFFRPLGQKEFSEWSKQKMLNAGFHISFDALHVFMERTEGNLLCAAQSIEKLKLSYPPGDLDIEAIEQWVSQDARFSLFDLVDALLNASLPRTKHIFSCLRNEVEPILVLWALTREVRTIIPMALAVERGRPIPQVLNEEGVWKHRMPILTHFLKRILVSDLQQFLIKAKKIDDIIKGYAKGNVWDGLYGLCLELAGVRLNEA